MGSAFAVEFTIPDVVRRDNCVLFSYGSPDIVCHVARPECSIEHPHPIAECRCFEGEHRQTTHGERTSQLRARWKGQQWEATGQSFWDHCEFRLINGDITMLVDMTEPPEGWEWIL